MINQPVFSKKPKIEHSRERYYLKHKVPFVLFSSILGKKLSPTLSKLLSSSS